MRLNLRAKLVELFSSHNPEKLDELIAPQYVVIGDSEYFADTDWRKDQGSHPSKYTGNCLAFSKLFGQISSRISDDIDENIKTCNQQSNKSEKMLSLTYTLLALELSLFATITRLVD